MLIDLTRLIQNFDEKLEINEVITFDKSYFENTDILDLSKIEVVGDIRKNEASIYDLNLTISGTMILPCSMTLKEVEYPFEIKAIEVLSENKEEDEEYLKLTGNYLDIIPIVWQNIVMEIPLKVTAPDAYKAKLHGDGWQVITEEDMDNEKIDPRLESLSSLLEEKEEE